jgi:CBS domain-containing protein
MKLVDLALGSLEEDYPAVKHLVLRPVLRDQPGLPGNSSGEAGNTRLILPLEAVEAVEWQAGRARVPNLDAFQAVASGADAKEVLLKRDILDNFIIDLQNTRVTRANDLSLDEQGGLRLRAADTGLRALIRRTSGGLYRGYNAGDLQDWKYVEFLRGEPGAVSAGAGYQRRIEELPAGEIAHLAGELPYLQAAELVLLVPGQLAADILELMTPERQLQVFEELPEEYALQVLEKMAPDIAADLVGHLATEDARRFLNRLPKKNGELIIDLLRYPEDSVGGIMTNDVVFAPAGWTVAQARAGLRDRLQEPDFVYFVYLVEDEESRRLRGVVTLRSIMIARDDQRLEEIMNPYLVALSPLDVPRKAAYRLINNQLAALPVVSQDGRLLGAVTVDAAVSLVAPGSWSSQAPRIFS